MKLIHPEVTHGIVNRATNTLFSYQGWPTVARDENGTLYVASSSFRISHVCPFGKTAMYVSKNNGESWTPPTVINDTYLDDRDGGLLYMGNGRMLVTWFTLGADYLKADWSEWFKKYFTKAELDATYGMINAYDELPKDQLSGASLMRISEDHGVSWSDTLRMPISAPHGPNVCRDGSLIYLGLEYCSNGELPAKTVALYKSFDGGYNWEKISVITPPDWLTEEEFLDEPHIMELPDGRLLAAFRIEGHKPSFTIATAFSEDGGKTWSDIVSTGVSGSPPHLMLHSSGAVICTYGRREHPFGERAIVSYDLGKSWEEEYILDESYGNDLGYPSTVELDDGSLISVYYQKYEDDKKCSILYTKWRLNKR